MPSLRPQTTHSPATSVLATKQGRLLAFLLTAWLVIGLDQLFKSLVISNLKPGQSVPFIGELVKLYLVYNDSAAFSIGFGLTWIFTIISALAMLVILWFGPKLETIGWAATGGLALGGVVGNLIDRLTRAPGFGVGQVVDYIQIPFNFPIFNLADMAIVSVACFTVLRVLAGTSVGKAPVKKNG
jgi:signal peptidase II